MNTWLKLPLDKITYISPVIRRSPWYKEVTVPRARPGAVAEPVPGEST